jgi:beta-glucosidase
VPVFRFPDRFLWGAATASYQIEGSPLADGAGPSIWHTFAHTPNTIQNGDTGDVACDHYRRYAEDVDLMRRIGLKSYRFSTSWGRVLPTGRAKKNAAGLSFYDRLVDRLLEAGIEPALTLYHWDLPQALEDSGGWVNPDAPKWFADYAGIMGEALADRVKLWITFNEPWVFVWIGHALGIHAPGRTDSGHALAAARNVLLAHGHAVERLRAARAEEVGITLSVQAYLPASASAEDHAAAARQRAFNNEWFLDPIVHGSWPDAVVEEFGDFMPELSAEDLGIIRRPIDFVGLNYYTRHVVAHDPSGFFKSRPLRPVGQRTEMDWEVYPPGLYLVLREFHERYGLPLYVTENGASFPDPSADADGYISDWERLRYLQSHFEAAHRAISEGVDLRGYYVWSLMDNFEWGFGYSKRFGLIGCDFATQRRTLKQSALWYRDVIQENGV